MSRFGRACRLVGTAAVIGLVFGGCASLGPAAVGSPVGAWSETSDEGSPVLMLSEDGRVSGNDGCNQLSGEWVATDEGVAFDKLASTRMACPDVQVWLDKAASATIDGDTMTVLDSEGEELGTLQRDDGY